MTDGRQRVRVLVTGARGFVGRNLCVVLRQEGLADVREIDIDDPPEALEAALREAEVIFHLAGANRPREEGDFAKVNAGVTRSICARLRELGRKPKIVLSSSIQVERDNPYGRSKREAEQELEAYCRATGADGVVFRLKNLFGKWCRPNYNSVTATFCHNIAHDLPIQISDPGAVVDLTYVDDVVAGFCGELRTSGGGYRLAAPLPSTQVTLGALAATIQGFHAHRKTLVLPDYASGFTRALYATYLSYLEPQALGYGLEVRSDARGSLAEFVKSPHFGQIFVSRTKPGITRGDHYHHTKTEKFMVVQGEAVIRLRHVESTQVVEFRVRGEEYRVVDIAPGYTHSIENVGSSEVVTLFWSSEVFDPARPDTYRAPVLRATQKGTKP